MNALTLGGATVVTMTSLELVDFINSQRGPGEAEVRHDDFMRKAPKVLGEGVRKFSDTYRHAQNGQSYPCYRFPKREACLMAMSYSYELQAKVFDRMTAAEARTADPMVLLNNPAVMRDLLLGYTEKVLALELTVAEQAPKVAYADALLKSDGTLLIGQAAKMLELPVLKTFAALRELKVLLLDNMPSAEAVKRGYFEAEPLVVKTKTRGDIIKATPRVTTRGIEFIRRASERHPELFGCKRKTAAREAVAA